MKIVFMGTPSFSVPVLESLYNNSEYEIVGVVSQPDKKIGRKQLITPSPISDFALSKNLNLLRIENIKKDYSEVLSLKPDIIITCAYGQIIPEEVLNYPEYGCINIHASLLPKYRGGAPIQRAIINGDSKTGITIMYMDKLMDNGDIIKQESLIIEDYDNLETLTTKLSILGRDLLNKTLPSIFNKTNERIKQDESQVIYAYNIKREEEHLDFSKSCKEVFNKVRALSPKPACYINLNNKIIKVYDGYMTDDKSKGKSGEIVKIYKDGIGVNTRDFIYVITSLQLEGKKKMLAKDYIRGCNSNLIGEIYD